MGGATLQKTGERKQWLDFLRGVAMLLVVWEHLATTWTFEFAITGAIKMPLFFAITGYLFHDRKGNVLLFLKKLFFSIILPWFLLSLVWLKPIYALLTGHADKIPGYFYTFISGETLWFFPCLILAECLFFLIRKFIKNVYVQYAVMFALAAAGMLINGGGKVRFALWDNAMIVQAYLLFGYWFRNNEALLYKTVGKWQAGIPLAVVYAALVGVTLYFYPGAFIDVHHAKYFNLPICIVMIFVGLLLLFVYAQKLPRFPRWIVFVGQNTLLFYIGHYWPRSVLSLAERYLHIALPDNVLGYVVKFVFICVVMSVLALLFNRFLPFAVGKKGGITIKFRKKETV